MTSAEGQQLVEFLGNQFTESDRRFGEVDLRVTELRAMCLMAGPTEARVTGWLKA